MNQLLKYLDGYKPEPMYAQISAGGNWEEALRISFNGPITLSKSIDMADDPSVAVEVFYRLNDGRIVFMGFRYSPLMKSVSSSEEFLSKFNEILKLVPHNNIRAIFAELGWALDDNQNSFLDKEPSYAEIGVVDNWQSLGSLILRKQGEPPHTEESLVTILEQNKILLRNQKNHVSLEFAFNNPQFWVAIQTSVLKNKDYVTDLGLLTQLVNML